MNAIRWAAIAVALLLASAATAGEEKHMNFAIAIDDGDGPVTLDLDSDDMGFSLHDLQVGETRSIVDKAGRNVMVTRTDDGFSFDVDGKKIDLPMLEDAHGMAFATGDANVDVQVVHDAGYAMAGDMTGVTIISGEPIDDATRESIRSALISSGHSGEVNFIDRSGDGEGPHAVRIIRKDVKVTH